MLVILEIFICRRRFVVGKIGSRDVNFCTLWLIQGDLCISCIENLIERCLVEVFFEVQFSAFLSISHHPLRSFTWVVELGKIVLSRVDEVNLVASLLANKGLEDTPESIEARRGINEEDAIDGTRIMISEGVHEGLANMCWRSIT